MEFSFFSRLGCPKSFLLYLQREFIGLKGEAHKGQRKALYVQLAQTRIHRTAGDERACAGGLRGPLGHPSTHFAAWFVPAGCCDLQGRHCLGSAGASPCHCLGVSPSREEMPLRGEIEFKLLEQVCLGCGVTQAAEFFTIQIVPLKLK